jgi:hypothetical protein
MAGFVVNATPSGIAAHRVWVLDLSELGRPPTVNADHQLHHFARSKVRKNWRTLAATMARAAGIPPLTAVDVTVQGRYPGGVLPDTDALQPAVKGVLDGLVDSGVIPDDRGEFVHSLRFLAPRVEPGRPPSLLVQITEAQP